MGLRVIEQSDAARPLYLWKGYRPCDGVEVGSEASVGALATGADLAIRHGHDRVGGPYMGHRFPMTNRFRRAPRSFYARFGRVKA